MVAKGNLERSRAISRRYKQGWMGAGGGGLGLYRAYSVYLKCVGRVCGDSVRSLSQWLCGGILAHPSDGGSTTDGTDRSEQSAACGTRLVRWLIMDSFVSRDVLTVK